MEKDNKTAHLAAEYDAKVRVTIPNYDFFHSETINLVKTINKFPDKWLDTGCGTGNFAISAAEIFSNTRFILADPSVDMLAVVKDKLIKREKFTIEVLESVSTEDLTFPDKDFDVITAIQSHHYLDMDGRKEATQNCFRMLKDRGVYITFENIRPFSEAGIRIGIERWKQFQLLKGKSLDEVEKHASRFGREYFPITIQEHLTLLREAGFSTAEVFWVSYMQAGFFAIKN
jgi:tRNA (cmo5U34)-methyltransferase